MYKVSIVGIDNTGKTSIVESFESVDGVGTIHTFGNYQISSSRAARVSGRLVDRLTKFGEQYHSRLLTGFGYVLHFFPYIFDRRTKKSYFMLISDRDPIIDSSCYAEFYLPFGRARIMRSTFRFIFEHIFNYPNLIFHLQASPEVSARRGKHDQLHEAIAYLPRLKELFDREVGILEEHGIPVIKIDTNTKSIEEVATEVRYHLSRINR